jgi:hypothetical protein
MTISDEAKQIRDEVAKVRPGRGRKYTRAFQERVVAWYERAQKTMHVSECSKAIGIPVVRLEKWCDAKQWRAATRVPAPEVPKPSPATSMIPVTIRDDLPFGPSISFATPIGYRIDGLTLEQAIGLLRKYE